MKTQSLSIIAVFMLATFSINAQTVAMKDTTVYFNQKKIEITDSLDQVKVKVYKLDTTEYKQVYEAIYTDEQTYERYSVASQLGFDFPFIKRKRKSQLTGHFTGVGIGALYTHDNFADYNDAGGMKTAFSNEFTFNPIGYTLPIVNNYFGLTTGLGMTWKNVHSGNNTHLVNNSGNTVVEPAPEGIKYYYSRLRMFDINVPVYLELHPAGNNKFYVMGGVLFGVNTFSSYKVKYKNESDRKIKVTEGKDYNVNPFSLSYVAQMGWDDIGVYAKYTPTQLFKNDKGPDVQTLSVGLILSFN